MTQFGLQLPNFTYGVADSELIDRVFGLAQAGESSGFESVWVMDHFWQLPPLGGPTQPMLEAYTLLGALATRTTRARLGALVTGVTYRNPALLAKMITTLDVISKGRAILGIGAAWHEEEHDGLGFAFPPVRERMERLEEALRICRAMFTEDTPTFEGRHYRIRAAHNIPRPIQPGGPPIMVGGGGEQRTLRLVAQYADMCNVAGNVETVRHKLSILRKHCEAVGRDPAEITTSRLATLFVTGSDEETSRVRDFLVQVAGAEAAAGFNVGQAPEIVNQVGELVEAGLDYLIFNLPLADADGVGQAGELLTTNFSST